MRSRNHVGRRTCWVAMACLALGSMSADTPWGGAISQNTTWTKSGSPHRIIQDLTVTPGTTLTIEPGCDVRFPGTSITVLGSLLALGTAENPIRLGSGDALARGGSITCQSSGVIEFRYGHFSVFSGVRILRTAEPGTPLFSHCVFRNVTGDCFTASETPVRILDSVFREVAGYGINYSFSSGDRFFLANSFDQVAPTILRNVFDKNALNFHSESFPPSTATTVNLKNIPFFKDNRVLGGVGIAFSCNEHPEALGSFVVEGCDLSGCNPSLVLQNMGLSGPFTVRRCSLASIVGSGNPLEWNLGGNYWGSERLDEVQPRVGGGAVDASILLPLLPAPPFPQADVDESDSGRRTTQADADLVKRYLVGLATLSAAGKEAADVDGTGEVDVRDALLIQSYVNGLLWKLPNR